LTTYSEEKAMKRIRDWVKEILVGRATVELWTSVRRDHKYYGRPHDDDVNESRWIVQDDDWPLPHSDDVPDRRADELICAEPFSSAATRLADSFTAQPLMPDPRHGEQN
jgi:hypothetical protein